jgi:hypothetical protein
MKFILKASAVCAQRQCGAMAVRHSQILCATGAPVGSTVPTVMRGVPDPVWLHQLSGRLACLAPERL